MKEHKYWVNGYNEVLGGVSVGFKDNTDAFNYYCEELKKIRRDGGEIELLEISIFQSYNNKGKQDEPKSKRKTHEND